MLINKTRISKIITYLVSNRTEITVKLNGAKDLYKTKLIKINHGGNSSHIQNKAELIIEKLFPAQGNGIIQSVPEVTSEFIVQNRRCRFTTGYQGINNIAPYYGFILSYPESIEFEEKRKEERVECKRPEFITAEFRIGLGSKNSKLYELNVIDSSKNGLGIVTDKKNSDLIEKINPGDTLQDITLYATWARITVNGTVRHKTKLANGEFRGGYIIGIESPDIIQGVHA